MTFYEITGKDIKGSNSFTIPQLISYAENKGIKIDPWALKRHLLVGTRDMDILLDPSNHTYDLKRERLNTDKYKARTESERQRKLQESRMLGNPDWIRILQNI